MVGKDCPHIKETKSKKTINQLTFSFQVKNAEEDLYNFVAPDDETLWLWVDGLQSVCGQEPTSKQALLDLDTLLNMEVKIRLLDLEGIHIPNTPPPIPPPPPHFDFAYE